MQDPKKEAKDFILNNSPKWQEAVDNGYHLMMKEDEILDWMVKFRNTVPKRKVAQKCPICQGEGRVPNGWGSTSSSLFTICTACSGLKMVIVEQA